MQHIDNLYYDTYKKRNRQMILEIELEITSKRNRLTISGFLFLKNDFRNNN